MYFMGLVSAEPCSLIYSSDTNMKTFWGLLRDSKMNQGRPLTSDKLTIFVPCYVYPIPPVTAEIWRLFLTAWNVVTSPTWCLDFSFLDSLVLLYTELKKKCILSSVRPSHKSFAVSQLLTKARFF